MTPNQQVLSDEQIDIVFEKMIGYVLLPKDARKAARAIESATLAALAQQAQEVAWQCRFKENAEWSECSKEHHDWVKRCPHEFVGYEARELYTSPPAPQATKGGGA